MANKRLTLLQSQRAKLKKQRALATTPKAKQIISRKIQQVTVKIVEAQKALKGSSAPKALKGSSPQKALPPGKKGGPIKNTRGPRRTNVNQLPKTKPQVGTRGGGVRPQLRLPPGGKTAANLLKNSAVARSAGSKLGGIGLALSGVATAQDLTASLKRGEGYASLPRVAKAILKGKNQKKTTGGKTNRRGRNVSTKTATPTKPAKRGMSNIPVGEGTGKGSPNDKKPKTTPAPAATKSGGKVTGSKPKTTVTKAASSTKPAAKKSKTSTLNKEIAGAKAFINKYKDKKGAMSNAVKQARERLKRLQSRTNQDSRAATFKAYGGGNRNY